MAAARPRSGGPFLLPASAVRCHKAPCSSPDKLIARERETLTDAEIEQLARFDEHWRVILADDDPMLVRGLAKRGYLDVLKRRVPLYRLSDLGREALLL